MSADLTQTCETLHDLDCQKEVAQAELRGFYQQHAQALRLLGDAQWLQSNFDAATAEERRAGKVATREHVETANTAEAGITRCLAQLSRLDMAEKDARAQHHKALYGEVA